MRKEKLVTRVFYASRASVSKYKFYPVRGDLRLVYRFLFVNRALVHRFFPLYPLPATRQRLQVAYYDIPHPKCEA